MITRLRSVLSRLRSLLRGREAEERLSQEWQLHLELLTEDHVREGLSLEEARRQARLKLGGQDRFKEECREQNGFRPLEELRQDVSYTRRILAKSPGFTFVVVFTLALGIGANTAVFSLVDAFLFRPFPVREPGRLIRISGLSSYPDFLDYRMDGQVFSDMAAARDLMEFPIDQTGEFVWAEVVTANYFDMLGLRMTLGRAFLKGEDDFVERHPVVVVSHRFWQRTLGSDPGIIGKTIGVEGEPLTIVGVAPRGFSGLDMAAIPPDLWLPISMLETVKHLESDPVWHNVHLRRRDRWMGIVGRLAPGVSFEQARARVALITEQLKKSYPETDSADWQPKLVHVGGSRGVRQDSATLFKLLAAAAICLLTISCTNIAGLLFARAVARQREIATRLAVGASRSRLIRQLFTESLVLSVLAFIVSLGVFHFLLELLPWFARNFDPVLDVSLHLDRRIFVLCAATSAVATALFGVAPALAASRQELTSALKGQGLVKSRIPKTGRLGSLVVAQVILSVILLIGAGLFIRAILHFESLDPGFNRSNVIIVPTSLRKQYGSDSTKGAEFCRRSLELIRTIPGVSSAAWAAGAPLQNDFGAEIITDNDKARGRGIDCNYVTPDYLKTVGIPILRGRDFNEHDTGTSAPVMIVNETMARRYWPDEDPLGKRVDVQWPARGVFQVIGVARDAKYSNLWEEPKPFGYFIGAQLSFVVHLKLHVRVRGDPRTLVASVRKSIETAEPGAQVGAPHLISELIRSSLSREQSLAGLLGLFGVVGLLVTAVGLYGMFSFVTAQRTREFGIRMALGARRQDLLLQVSRQGLGLVLAGLAVALPCSYALTRLIESRLHGIGPFDLLTYAAVSLVCVAVAIVAVLIPARRASARPTDALRFE